jgi:hypothetical protein
LDIAIKNNKNQVELIREEIKDINIKPLIHWTKRRFVYNVISQIQVYQNKSYDLIPVYQIQTLIEKTFNQKFITEDKQLFDISLLREPRICTRNDLVE